jgi:plastocyanin
MIRERAKRSRDARRGLAARCLAGGVGLVLLITPTLGFGADAGPIQVTIKNLKFMPPEVSVPVGTTVVWVNNDDEPHTVTAQQKQFKSKPLDKNDTFSVAFDKPGEYHYFCSIHPFMIGVVKVGEPTH